MSSRPYFNFFRQLFSTTKSNPDWQMLWNTQERVIEAERKSSELQMLAWNRAIEAEKKLSLAEQLLLEYKIGALQRDVLRLRNNFNLRGALEYSLDAYGDRIKAPQASKTYLLEHLMKDPEYTNCLETVTERLQLRGADVNMCAHVLYHELSKHAHGNTAELIINNTEHTMTGVAAIEAVFCTLKTKTCFEIPMKIRIWNESDEHLDEHTL
jgi:hypothetical protein